MADQKVNLKDIPLATKSQLTSNDSLLGLINEGAGGTKRIRVADVQTDLTEVNSSITTLTENLSTLQTTVQGLSGLSTDIDALESHTSSSNSNVSNANLSSLINSLANKEGYEIKTSQSGNPTIGRIAPQSGDYPPLYSDPVSTSFIDILSSNILGAAPSVVSGSGDSAVYNLPYNTNNVLSSNFVLDLRKNIFDNEWIENRPYMAGTVVIYNNELYKAIQNTSSATFDTTKWTKLSSGSGGGIGGTNFEIWKRLRNLVLEGISKELNPNYAWTNPNDTVCCFYTSDASNNFIQAWENDTDDYLGYQYNSYIWGFDLDRIWPNGKGDRYDEGSWSSSYPNVTTESVQINSVHKIRTNIIQMLSLMVDSYNLFINSLSSNRTSNPKIPPQYKADTIDIGTTPYDDFVITGSPRYTTKQDSYGNNYNVQTSNSPSSYEDESDLIKRLINLTRPKIVYGVFRAQDWHSTFSQQDTNSNVHWCHLYTDDSTFKNPDKAMIVHKLYNDQNTNDIKYVFNDVIMDVALERYSIKNETVGADNATVKAHNKAILEAYNLIEDLNISHSDTTTDQTSDIYYGQWNDVIAYINADNDVPEVDIPVKFLVYEKPYNREQWISNS